MKIRILSPWKQSGLLKEQEREYLKRLKRYTPIEVEEIKGAKGESREAVRKEGERLLARVREGSFLAALTERGTVFDSPGFSGWLEQMAVEGLSGITFVIGGAAGLDKSVVERADMRLSLSPMTLPHQLARLVLIEQIYRAFTIIRGEPYHK